MPNTKSDRLYALAYCLARVVCVTEFLGPVAEGLVLLKKPLSVWITILDSIP